MDFTYWFKSYFGGRQQVVIANDVSSEPMTVKCTVGRDPIDGWFFLKIDMCIFSNGTCEIWVFLNNL